MYTDGGGRRSRAFCSARDRVVPVLVRSGSWESRVPSPRDATEAVTCLDHGVRCTGWLCPLFAPPQYPIDPLRRMTPASGSPVPPDTTRPPPLL